MIEIKDVKKDYPAGDMVVQALKGVSINFRNNEFVSILGPSGCGKTTLLNIVGGLDQYTSGDIVIDGVSTKDYKDKDWDTYRNHYIGFVFQSYNLISHLSILENVELALSIAGISKKEKRAKSIDALERVGLGDQIKKRPNQLSGGQMQRVAIARAIVNSPKIILADEPTGALDSETSVQVMDILKEISKTCLVVMVTHNGELAEQYSDRIIKILDGELIHDSDPYEPDENERKKIIRREVKKEEKRGKWIHRQSAMTVSTAFSLSFKNLISKKWKTILVSFAGSIGIIGIALVLAVSNGLNTYISGMQSDTLSGYPVTIGTVAVDFNSISNFSNKNESDADKNTQLETYDMQKIIEQFGSFNYLNADFVKYIDDYYKVDLSKSHRELTAIKYSYKTTMQVLTEAKGLDNDSSSMGVVHLTQSTQTSALSGSSDGFIYQGIDNKDYILQNYDVLGGEKAYYPTNKNEVAIVVDKSNSVAVQSLMQYGIILDTDTKYVDFDKIIGKEYKVLANNTYYDSSNNYQPIQLNSLSDYPSNLKVLPSKMQEYYDNCDITLKVTCVLRAKENAVSEVLSDGIMYLPELTDYLINDAKQSDIYNATKLLGVNDTLYVPFVVEISELSSLMGGASSNFFRYNTLQEMIDEVNSEPFNLNISSEDAMELALQMIGASIVPSSISIYTNSFDAKQNVINYIGEWNKKDLAVKNKISYSDATAFLTETLGNLIDIISYVLIAFAGISLVVSSIMIGIITYTSVIERTKEIGVLRSIGARKKDISRVFNSETFIIGFVAGTIGVVVSWILTFPISAIIKKVAGGAITTSMAILTLPNALILIAISTILTLISGLIPSRIASKKDPVKALRTE